jgi:putative transposase
MDYFQPLISEKTYHILSRAIGSEKLFIEYENYEFFLTRFDKYISPVADTLCYNLLPNHFHFIIEIKPAEELLSLFKATKKSNVEYDTWEPDFVMQQFSNFLNSYTKAFNEKYDRKGSLFINSLRRVPIEDDAQFSSTIFYVHKNAVHHGYCKEITDWRWSSYKTILSKSPTKIKRKEVLDWFGNEMEFVKFHSQPINLKNAVVLE